MRHYYESPVLFPMSGDQTPRTASALAGGHHQPLDGDFAVMLQDSLSQGLEEMKVLFDDVDVDEIKEIEMQKLGDSVGGVDREERESSWTMKGSKVGELFEGWDGKGCK